MLSRVHLKPVALEQIFLGGVEVRVHLFALSDGHDRMLEVVVVNTSQKLVNLLSLGPGCEAMLNIV